MLFCVQVSGGREGERGREQVREGSEREREEGREEGREGGRELHVHREGASEERVVEGRSE